MRGNTMEAPLKFISYPLKPLLSSGGKNVKYTKKYFFPCKDNTPTLILIFSKINVKGEGLYGHPV